MQVSLAPKSQAVKKEPREGGFNTRSYKRIDDRTYEFVNKTDRVVTTTPRNVISPDGKAMTQVTTGKNAQG